MRKAHAPQPESSPCSPHTTREKTARQWKPNPAKNKTINKKIIKSELKTA